MAVMTAMLNGDRDDADDVVAKAIAIARLRRADDTTIARFMDAQSHSPHMARKHSTDTAYPIDVAGNKQYASSSHA